MYCKFEVPSVPFPFDFSLFQMLNVNASGLTEGKTVQYLTVKDTNATSDIRIKSQSGHSVVQETRKVIRGYREETVDITYSYETIGTTFGACRMFRSFAFVR